MNYIKSVFILLLVSFTFTAAQAQIKEKKKEEKKVVIIKKTINDNGTETVEETVLEGADAENFKTGDIEMTSEDGHQVIRIEKEEEIEKDGKKEIRKETRILKIDLEEGEELTPEMVEELKKQGIDIQELSGEGDKKMIWISEDNEDVEIDVKGKKKVFITEENTTEMDVKKEVFLIKDGGQKETKAVVIQKEMDGEGQTLDLMSININVNINGKKKELGLMFEAAPNPTTVRVMDVEGKMIYTEVLKGFEGNFDKKIDLSKAATGPVFLTIQQEEKVFSEKIGM